MKRLIKIIFLGLLMFMVQEGYGQGIISEDLRKVKIKVDRADTILVGIVGGTKIYRFKGNVVFGHGNVAFYCDSAYQNSGQNSIEAFSNVRINRDMINISGDHLSYNGDTRRIVMGRNVIFSNGDRQKKSNYLKYKLKRI